VKVRVAKLFSNGGSQAVRLPADFRFDGDEVLIRRDPITGDVVLSSKPDGNTWARFFAVRDSEAMEPDFLDERPGNEPLEVRDHFAEAH
jgi:antitoxin VapB